MHVHTAWKRIRVNKMKWEDGWDKFELTLEAVDEKRGKT